MRSRSYRPAAITATAALGFLAWRAYRRTRRSRLRGQTVLITGGSRGLGLLLAHEFASLGCRIAICARDAQELERARADLARRGAEVLAVPCDIADPALVDELVRCATARFGRVDILVNNASIIQVGPLETMTLADFERVMAVNFWGGVYATLALLPQMRRRGSGRIVNITSIGAKIAVPHLVPYDCAKFALRGFSEGLRAELADTGIRVITIVPGLMRTGSPVNALFKGKRAREFAWFAISDALPITSMSARRAARRIVRACRAGEAEVILGWPARLSGLLHDLFPGTTARVLGLVDRLLPGANGSGTGESQGRDVAGALARSPLLLLLRRAAGAYNQFGNARVRVGEHAPGAQTARLRPGSATEPPGSAGVEGSFA